MNLLIRSPVIRSNTLYHIKCYSSANIESIIDCSTSNKSRMTAWQDSRLLFLKYWLVRLIRSSLLAEYMKYSLNSSDRYQTLYKWYMGHMKNILINFDLLTSWPTFTGLIRYTNQLGHLKIWQHGYVPCLVRRVLRWYHIAR